MNVFRALFSIFAIAATFGHGVLALSAPYFGRYVGVLHNDNTRTDQLAKLDFVVDRQQADTLELSAVLTLHFGDFASREYVSYYYENIQFNVVTGTLVFDKTDQPLTIVVDSFKGKEFEGEVRSTMSQATLGRLNLMPDTPARPTAPLVGRIWGTYQSSKGVLQLQTFRATNEIGDAGNPFSANGIKGRLGRDVPALGGLVVQNTFTAGAYDFFNQRLTLWGSPQTMECIVGPHSLNCAGEEFRRVAEDESQPPVLFPPTSRSVLGPVDSGSAAATGALGGQYRGFLHHEYLDQYQTAGLNLVAVQNGVAGSGALRISGVATLYFGDEGSREAIPYRFEPRAFPLNAKSFVLKRPGADAILQITAIEDGTLKGVWYSHLFGRVGTFVLSKTDAPLLPSGTARATVVSGVRTRTFWELATDVGLGVTSMNTANPFFPLTFGGYLWDRRGILIAKSKVTGGSYDFYTGRIALAFNVSGEDLHMVGTRDRDGRLDVMFYLSTQWGVRLVPHRLVF